MKKLLFILLVFIMLISCSKPIIELYYWNDEQLEIEIVGKENNNIEFRYYIDLELKQYTRKEIISRGYIRIYCWDAEEINSYKIGDKFKLIKIEEE